MEYPEINLTIEEQQSTEIDMQVLGGDTAMKALTQVGLKETGYISGTGAEVAHNDYRRTGYIPVDSDSVLTLKDFYVGSALAYAFYNAGKAFISGQGNIHGDVTVTAIPNGAAYVRFSSYIGTGEHPVAYVTNHVVEDVAELKAAMENRYVEVGPHSEFQTITAAINATGNWDTIFVHSGTYTENVKLWNKPRHLIGESRETTFIVDHSGAYATPPIEMSEGSLSNFTVIEDGTQAAQGADMGAYCLHIEWNPQTANSGLYVDNCTFINSIHAAMGCGLYQDYTVRFRNCSFFCGAANEGIMERGAFFFHANIGTGVTGQRMIAENCVIHSAGNKAVFIGTPYAASGGSCRYSFIGCTIWSDGKGISDDCVFVQTDSDTTITKMGYGYGNSVSRLNSSPNPGFIVENVSGTTPGITGKADHRYLCGEVSTLDIVAPAAGDVEVMFESGSTPTVLTVTSARSGVTNILWPGWFDPANLDADTAYDLIITDGKYGVVASWET